MVDPAEMPGGAPEPETWGSVGEKVTFRSANAVVVLAEQEEAQAQAWVVRLEATRAKVANAQEALDELRESIERKASFAARQDQSVAGGADEMRAALEVAMMKSMGGGAGDEA